MFELIRRVRDGELPIGALSGSAPDHDPNLRPPVTGWGQFYYDMQLATGLEWMNEAVAITRKPPLARPTLWAAWDPEVKWARMTRFQRWGAVLPIMLTPAARAAESATLRYEAHMGALAILLAAERHRIKHGGWPESLAAIDPAILPDPPHDPFTGKPFLLDRRDGRFLVHSIGPNLKDEYGDYDPKKVYHGGADDFGSAAWDVPLRRQPPRE